MLYSAGIISAEVKQMLNLALDYLLIKKYMEVKNKM